MTDAPHRDKWHQTSLRIVQHACRLTEERGFDGWTIEELAAAAEVSRRTVFNHFDSKLDILLGPEVSVGESELATFRAGGPTGVLLDDVLELARPLFDTHAIHTDSDVILDLYRVVYAEPTLLAAGYSRFEKILSEFAEYVVEREGESFGSRRAELLVRLMGAVEETLTRRMAEFPAGTSRADVFSQTLDEARELLTRPDSNAPAPQLPSQ